MDELGNNELELRRLEHEYSKLTVGELYFKIASTYENIMQYQQAIDWYNRAIASGTKIRESSKKLKNTVENFTWLLKKLFLRKFCDYFINDKISHDSTIRSCFAILSENLYNEENRTCQDILNGQT